MEKAYFLSENFDYSKTISPATGPAHAERNNWKIKSIKDVWKKEEEFKIIDNRLSSEECEKIKKEIKYYKNPVCFVIVDPYKEWCEEEAYYKMLYEIAKKENVFFLSKYEPKEVTEEIEKLGGEKKMIVYPYAYNDDKEFEKKWKNKRSKIFFSGNQHRNVYPYRYMFENVRKYWLPLSNNIDKLDHPGYPDIGEEKKHDIVGRKYIEEISEHQFMFISPSRCRLEFLKYGECAKAGTVPVGMPPAGFTPEMRDPFFELDFSSYPALIRSTHALFNMSMREKRDRVTEYRRAMRKYRSPDQLNRKLDAFIDRVWSE
jgi:hypothetical protein